MFLHIIVSIQIENVLKHVTKWSKMTFSLIWKSIKSFSFFYKLIVIVINWLFFLSKLNTYSFSYHILTSDQMCLSYLAGFKPAYVRTMTVGPWLPRASRVAWWLWRGSHCELPRTNVCQRRPKSRKLPRVKRKTHRMEIWWRNMFRGILRRRVFGGMSNSERLKIN